MVHILKKNPSLLVQPGPTTESQSADCDQLEWHPGLPWYLLLAFPALLDYFIAKSLRGRGADQTNCASFRRTLRDPTQSGAWTRLQSSQQPLWRSTSSVGCCRSLIQMVELFLVLSARAQYSIIIVRCPLAIMGALSSSPHHPKN